MDEPERKDQLWPWERSDPQAFRIVVRLLDDEWDVVERALRALDSEQAREVLYHVEEQTGHG
jgi:hypothetical protein